MPNPLTTDEGKSDDFGNDLPGSTAAPVLPPEDEKKEEEDTKEPVTDKLEDGEETPEEKAEREKLEAEEAKKRNIRIPKARFDQALEKARQREQALADELKALREAQGKQNYEVNLSEAQKKVNELQDKYEDLILDGKKDEARAVRRELDTLRESIIESRTTVKANTAKATAIEEIKFEAALAKVEGAHTELDPDSPEFDEDKVSEVVTLLEAFLAKGDNKAVALTKAVKYVMGEVRAPAEKAGRTAAETKAARDLEARKKAAEANGKQPASSTNVGINSDAAGTKGTGGLDLMKMSQDKFAKIDEDTLAALRGDAL